MLNKKKVVEDNKTSKKNSVFASIKATVADNGKYIVVGGLGFAAGWVAKTFMASSKTTDEEEVVEDENDSFVLDKSAKVAIIAMAETVDDDSWANIYAQLINADPEFAEEVNAGRAMWRETTAKTQAVAEETKEPNDQPETETDEAVVGETVEDEIQASTNDETGDENQTSSEDSVVEGEIQTSTTTSNEKTDAEDKGNSEIETLPEPGSDPVAAPTDEALEEALPFKK